MKTSFGRGAGLSEPAGRPTRATTKNNKGTMTTTKTLPQAQTAGYVRMPKAQGLYDPANEHDACGVGFVANIKGEKTHDIVMRGLQVNVNMTHRGAEGADNKSGDGAGILIQMPHEFFKSIMEDLPESGKYASGLVFLPKNADAAKKCVETLNHYVESEGLSVIGWRDVPVDSSCVGEIALRNEPCIKQIFIRSKGEEAEIGRASCRERV